LGLWSPAKEAKNAQAKAFDVFLGSMMAKLSYRVVASSGSDPEFPANELNVHSPETRGWQTSRFCE